MAKTTEAPATPPTADNDAGTVARMASKRDKWKSAAALMTSERDKARGERDALQAEIDALKATPHSKQVAALKQEIRDRDHRDVFNRIASDKGVKDPKALGDLWRLSEYKAETDTVDEDAIGALIDTQKTERAYLFGEPSPAKEGSTDGEKPITPGSKLVPGNGRGGAHNPAKSGVVVTRAQMADPKFMLNPANKELITSAAKEGRFGRS